MVEMRKKKQETAEAMKKQGETLASATAIPNANRKKNELGNKYYFCIQAKSR